MEIASSTSSSRRDGVFCFLSQCAFILSINAKYLVGCISSFLGGGKVVALGLILKQLIIIGSHSQLKWDKPFYQYAALRPIIKILERIIITPAFHHSHHGTSRLDTASEPDGNFGNMFSLWDQLFGTATFQSSYPKEYGLQQKTNDPWTASYFYPFVKSPDLKSEWSAGFKKTDTTALEALSVSLTKGEAYLWCACGMSKISRFAMGRIMEPSLNHKNLL